MTYATHIYFAMHVPRPELAQTLTYAYIPGDNMFPYDRDPHFLFTFSEIRGADGKFATAAERLWWVLHYPQKSVGSATLTINGAFTR
jgi:hypothetical protein